MFIDTHCHINMMVKKSFDTIMSQEELLLAKSIIDEAQKNDVQMIINVGTSLIESKNTLALAAAYKPIVAAIGIHPNDCTQTWREDLKELTAYVKEKERHKIVAIGECGMDFHYPNYDKMMQRDTFRAQIELALQYNCAIVVHTRDAGDETLYCLQEYKGQGLRGTIHCFSEDLSFAQEAINLGFVLGIGGTVTYPKNELLREVVQQVTIKNIILETDAPFLPPQSIRGKQNHPREIITIANFLAALLTDDIEIIKKETTNNALRIFALQH